jgi:photosystem II stability/assembly factor-like uncharacterized protein
MMRFPSLAGRGLILLTLLAVSTGRAAELAAVPAAYLEPLAVRPLGPANMGGRITALAVVEARPATLYAGAAGGGVWKTVNNGITWSPVFERRASVGAVAVAPSDPDVVWVGTGEANARNSVSWGDGVWRSADGGKTWEHRGLRETHHIGRIVVHPKNPDIVYVAALGHLWGPSKERGLFKTSDGGKTWDRVLAPDEDTGCIDLVLDSADPETLYAAAYRVRRGPFSGGNPAVQFGQAAGLYRSRDGGKNWTRLTKGLPARPLGRCGLDICRKDPRVLYAVVQTDRTNIKTTHGQAARSNDNPETGGVFCSRDRGDTWVKVNDLCPRPFYYGQVRADPRDDRLVYVLGIHLHVSRDGGRTFKNDGAPGVHGDHHALWIDPADPEHLVLGNDGGVYFSYDRGANWEHVRNLPVAQFYAAAVDLRKPYRVYGGLQDNGTWFGPSRTWSEEGITAADWQRVLGADGFFCQADPADPDTVYAEGQYGRLYRLNVRTGSETDIRPTPPSPLVPAYRFNWSSPLLLSPHNPRTVYYGGNHLFRSVDRGDRWEVLGPDLTLGKPGPSADMGHTLTAIAESPVKPGVLWAGSDDGRVLISRNGGAEWTNVSERVPGVPLERHVSRIECSPTAAGTAWLALDRHRQDDRAPYLFRTDDCGLHWKPLHGNLPREGPVYVVRASSRNPHLLFAGTEFGLFVSLDGGDSWQPLGTGLPAVPVHDLVLHPRDRDLVIATHGRGLFVLDAAPLEEMTAAVRAEAAHLFAVKPATLYEPRNGSGLTGGKNYTAPNPPYGATIWYALKEKASAPVRVVIADALGRNLAELAGSPEAGLHAVQWNLRGGAGLDLTRGARLVGPGDYMARLYIAGQMMMARKFRVEAEE